jgi:hypothetical protein
VARFLFFRQKGVLLLLVLSFILITSACGHKAPPASPEFAFSTVMEFHETALGDNGNDLKI